MEGVFIMRKKWDIETIREFVEAETDCTLVSTEYIKYAEPLEFVCGCGIKFNKTWAKFHSTGQRRCNKCAFKQDNKGIEAFSKEVFDLVGDEYTFHEYITANVKASLTHNKCGYTYKAAPSHFLLGKRCPYCNGGVKLGVKAFEKKLLNLYGDEIKVISGYTDMRTSAKFINIESGVEFTALPTNVIQGYSLGRKISNGEFVIKDWLDTNKVYYEYQYSFSDLKRKPFDFYVPDKNTLIEYDGEQHYKPIDYFGGEDKYKKQVKTDKSKTSYCNKNKIELIRIPYWKFDEINTILEDAFS